MLMLADKVPAVTKVPNTYVVRLVTDKLRLEPVLAANALDTTGLTAVIVALNGPVKPLHEVADIVPAVPPRPFTESAIVGLVPPQ